MTDARSFADTVGRKNMADALDVGATAVSNAVVRGKFPPSWMEACRNLWENKSSKSLGAFPVHLFGQKGSYSTRRGYAARDVQERSPENAGDAA